MEGRPSLPRHTPHQRRGAPRSPALPPPPSAAVAARTPGALPIAAIWSPLRRRASVGLTVGAASATRAAVEGVDPRLAPTSSFCARVRALPPPIAGGGHSATAALFNCCIGTVGDGVRRP
eukprot:317066-Chlamydomonas_euryale.AAC.3